MILLKETLNTEEGVELTYTCGMQEMDELLSLLEKLRLDGEVTFKKTSEPDGPNGQMTMHFWRATLEIK